MRKLATVRRIDNLESIPGADLIQVATIDGWKVVVKANEFKVNDRCVYFEIDSFLPVKPEFEFLRKNSYRNVDGLGEGFRLKTIKLRGQISQGLALPVTMLFSDDLGFVKDGADVTDILGVKKYEPPIPAQLAGNVQGTFPSFIPKTDQERIQNLTHKLVEWQKKNFTWEVTEKFDGCSMTVYNKDGEFGVCSRNWELKESNDNSLWKASRVQNLQSVLESAGNYALQGELIGEGIQGNPYKLKGQKFFVFDIFDIDKQSYLSPSDRWKFCTANNIDHVTFIEFTNLNSMTVGDILKMAEGKSTLNNNTEREGLVFKCEQAPSSFKAISNKFLLKNE